METSRMTPEDAKAAAAAAGIDTNGTDNTFGDVLSDLLRTLPADASALFLRSLSGLSPSESHDFCDHVSKLKPQKQFRVIHAMSEATVDGKRRFLQALAKKIAEQQAKQQVIQAQNEKDMEAHVKRKEAMQAKERVKQMNPAAKFHSFDASRGAGVAVKENVNGNASNGTADEGETGNSAAEVGVNRSLSSSSLKVTKEDIKQVGRLLSNSHITESEMNLRELEVNKKAFASLKSSSSDGSETVEMSEAAKRDRPDSIRELVKHDEKPLQRTRSEDTDVSYYDRPSQDNDEDGDNENDSPDGETQEAEDPEAPSTKRWTKLQDNALRESVRIHGEKNWKAIAELVPGRNHAQCLQRWRKVLKPGLVKGHWSFEEDQILEYLVTQGCNNWGQIAERIPGRTPKQCRERWKNHLDPAINKGPYTEEEDKIILDAQAKLGNKWSQIAQLLQGRTEDSVKIRWKSLKQNPAKAAASHAQQKKAQQQGHNQAHSASAMAYQQNPALLRQRQLQMMQQQQHIQHSEAAQLEHQQQLQQQQLQMRLHERMLQQQQMQRQQGVVNNNDLTVMKPDPSLTAPSPVSGLGMSMASSHLYSPAGGYHSNSSMSFTSQLNAASAGLDPSPYDFNIQSSSSSTYNYAGDYHHQSDSPHHHRGPRESGESWELADDSFARLGENPPPATFWDNYPKHPGMLPEPIPLTSQSVHPDHGHYGVPEEEVVYDDAMFEKLATELGSNSLHFAPI